MISKLIFLLFSINCIVQVYTACPHQKFLKKHVDARDNVNVQRILEKIKVLEHERVLVKVKKQTMYAVKPSALGSNNWVYDSSKNTCKWKTAQTKYEFEKPYTLSRKEDGNAYHVWNEQQNGRPPKKWTCPQRSIISLCDNCRNEAQAAEFAFENEVVGYVNAVNGRNDWEVNDFMHSCKLRAPAIVKYMFLSEWKQIGGPGTGFGLHSSIDGHLL